MRWSLRNALASLLVLLTPWTTPAIGQPTPAAGVVEFEDEPLVIDSLGLRVLIPKGAAGAPTKLGTQTTYRIAPTDLAWVIDIVSTERQSDTPETAADRLRTKLLESVGTTDPKTGQLVSQGRVLVNERNLSVNRRPAHRFYLLMPHGVGGTHAVRGATVLQPDPSRLIVISLVVDEASFAAVKPVYEALVAAIEFADPADVLASRAAAVLAGVDFLKNLAPSALSDVASTRGERWERFSQASHTGVEAEAKELGYRRTSVWLGQRGEVDPKLPKERWGSVEAQSGILVRMEVRMLDLEDPSSKAVVDTQGTFFVTPDGSEEAWLIRTARRTPGRAATSWREMGARQGYSMTVRVEGSGMTPESFRPTFEGEGYVSQVHSFLLPDLLVRAGMEATYGFYVYRSTSSQIRLRRDTLERPVALDGLWRLRTKVTEDSPEQVTVFSKDGVWMRTELGDGRVWEPTTLQELMDLWKAKGLPVE